MNVFTNIIPTNEEIKTNYGFIYVTVNNTNNKIYVGQKKFKVTKNTNKWKSYLGSGIAFKKSIKKYGKENFKKYIVELCSEEEIDTQEIYWISKLNAMDRTIGYNLCEGGGGTRGGTRFMSDEQKEKQSIFMKEQWNNADYKETTSKSISNAFTSDRRVAQSSSTKERWVRDGHRENVSKRVSDSWTDERKQLHGSLISDKYKDDEYRNKMSKSISDSWTDEMREKHSNTVKLRFKNPEYLKKVCKHIICEDSDGNIVWEGAIGKKGMISKGFSPSCVYACCSGKQKKYKGLTFRYKE